MVSTSQYLGYEDYHEMSGLRSPEQGSTARPGAQGAGVLESLVSWEEQTQQNLGSIIVITPFTHNISIMITYDLQTVIVVQGASILTCVLLNETELSPIIHLLSFLQ